MIHEMTNIPHYRYYVKDKETWSLFCEEHKKWFRLTEPWAAPKECPWCHEWFLLVACKPIGQRNKKNEGKTDNTRNDEEKSKAWKEEKQKITIFD